MYPLGHFLLAFVPVTAYALVRRRRPPAGPTVLLVLAGTQLPDVIDKPLSWTFAVLPSGRMFAHSLLISLPVLSLLVAVAARRGYGRPAVVFALAYLSHLAGDFYPALRLGTEYYFFPNMFWPLLSANPDRVTSFAAHSPDSLLPVVVAIAVFGVATSYGLVTMYLNRVRPRPVPRRR